MNHATVGLGSALETYLAMLALSFVVLIPFTAIAICVLRSPKEKKDATELGLGEVSLHDELWNFIEKFERGEVTLSPLETHRTIGVVGEQASSKSG